MKAKLDEYNKNPEVSNTSSILSIIWQLFPVFDSVYKIEIMNNPDEILDASKNEKSL